MKFNPVSFVITAVLSLIAPLLRLPSCSSGTASVIARNELSRFPLLFISCKVGKGTREIRSLSRLKALALCFFLCG